MKVSGRSVDAASKVHDKGSLALQKAVEDGNVSVSAASVVADLSKLDQTTLVKKGPRAVKNAAKELRDQKPSKNGAIKKDARELFKSIHQNLGKVARTLDDVARVRGGQGPKHGACMHSLNQAMPDIDNYEKGGK